MSDKGEQHTTMDVSTSHMKKKKKKRKNKEILKVSEAPVDIGELTLFCVIFLCFFVDFISQKFMLRLYFAYYRCTSCVSDCRAAQHGGVARIIEEEKYEKKAYRVDKNGETTYRVWYGLSCYHYHFY